MALSGRNALAFSILVLGGCKREPAPHAGSADAAAPVATTSTVSAAGSASASGACGASTCGARWVCDAGACTRETAWRIEELAVGAATFGCARYANGQVWCAGQNAMAQLGRGTRAAIGASDVEGPAPVGGVTDATRLVAGVMHACALVKDGRVWCWGFGTSGEVGGGSFDVVPTAVAVAGITDAIDIAAGTSHTCALRKGGRVACWGFNDAGQLGDGTKENRAQPVDVKGVVGAKELALGFHHSCALVGAGVTCWGSAGGKSGVAAAKPGIANAEHVAAAAARTCVTTRNAVTCFGDGSLSDAPSLHDALRLAGGNDTMCGLTAAGAVTCIDTRSPKDAGVAKSTTARLLAVGGSWECVVRRDEQVECNAELPTRAVLQAL